MKFDGYQLVLTERSTRGSRCWPGVAAGPPRSTAPLPLTCEGRLSVGPGGGWRQGEVVAVRRDGAVLEVAEKDKVEDMGKD